MFYNDLNSYKIIQQNNLVEANPNKNKIYLLDDGTYKVYNVANPNKPHTGSVLELEDIPGVLSKSQKKELELMLDRLLDTLSNPEKAEKLNNLVMKILSKRNSIESKNETHFAENIEAFIFKETVKSAQYPLVDAELQATLDALSKRVSTKFLEAHALVAHKKLITQLNQYMTKLETNLNNPLKVQPLSLNQVKEQNRLTGKLAEAKEVHSYLINPDPTTLSKNIQKIRGVATALSVPNTPKNELTDIIQEMLKLSDPYYNHIQKLDTYLAKLEKDLADTPQDPAISVGANKSDRLIKKEIAQKVSALLLNPSSTDLETGESNLSINKINGAITRNTSVTHTFIGKGRLDDILNDILHSIEPVPYKKKAKP